jgi:rod shape determining protein RodA
VQIDRRLVAHFDWTLLLLALAFVAIGVTTIYSANYDIAEKHAGVLPSRQVLWLGLGIIAMLTAVAFDYRHLDRLAYPFYAHALTATSGSIGWTFRGGSQRWINLGFFRLQPSEPAKTRDCSGHGCICRMTNRHGFRLRSMGAVCAGCSTGDPDPGATGFGTAIILGIVFLSMILMWRLRPRSFSI